MSKEFSELIKMSVKLSGEYAEFQKANNQKEWTAYDRTIGLVGDVGDLCKLIQSKFNLRKEPEDIDLALSHELGDCLWSIVIISKMLDIDIENSYLKTLENIQSRIEAEKERL